MKINAEFDSIVEMLEFAEVFKFGQNTHVLSVSGNPFPATPTATPAPTEPDEAPETSEDAPRKKLQGKQHISEANKMIDAGERDPEIYELLSDNQKTRVDEALATKIDKIEDVKASATEGKTPDELRSLIKEKVTSIQAGGDVKVLTAVRAAMVEILDDQGTDYDKPRQSMIEESNLGRFNDKLIEIMAEFNVNA